jgi:hypothetical protein
MASASAREVIELSDDEEVPSQDPSDSSASAERKRKRAYGCAAAAAKPPPCTSSATRRLLVRNVSDLPSSLPPDSDAKLCCLDTRLPQVTTRWDCGYVNVSAILDVLSRRQPSVRTHLGTAATSARVRDIQQLVDKAWRSGYDPEGARQHGGRLLGKVGRAGWLGAAETLVLLWHIRVEAFILEVVDRPLAGRAVYEAATACFAAQELPAGPAGDGDRRAPTRRPPILLQGDGHSQLLLGTLTSPERLLIRDPSDAPGLVRCVAPQTLDGRQYQLVVCGRAHLGAAGEDSLAMSEPAEAARRRNPELEAAAMWHRSAWQYAGWCGLRFPPS